MTTTYYARLNYAGDNSSLELIAYRITTEANVLAFDPRAGDPYVMGLPPTPKELARCTVITEKAWDQLTDRGARQYIAEGLSSQNPFLSSWLKRVAGIAVSSEEEARVSGATQDNLW